MALGLTIKDLERAAPLTIIAKGAMKPYSRYSLAEHKVDSVQEMLRGRSQGILLPENDRLLRGVLDDLSSAMKSYGQLMKRSMRNGKSLMNPVGRCSVNIRGMSSFLSMLLTDIS